MYVYISNYLCLLSTDEKDESSKYKFLYRSLHRRTKHMLFDGVLF